MISLGEWSHDLKRVLLFFVLIALAWGAGFAMFINRLPSPTLGGGEKADGVAVYTGGRGARISAGMSLFSDGAGDRLLISGVHQDTTRERLAELWPGGGEQFSCCVDLGRSAQTTQGNAREVSNWRDENDFKSILIVTSDFHMPRAFATTRAAMPNVRIIPYTVESEYLRPNGMPRSGRAWLLLAGEYTKFLVVKARFTITHLFRTE